METISHRELRNNSADILRRVSAGESFDVSNNGVVVAHLSPAEAPRYKLPFPVSRPARRVGGWHELPTYRLSRPSQEILDELREDRI